MPTLPSFITYRPGKKAKAAIKAPFSLLRGDSSTTSSTASHQQFTATDVLDINSDRYSLDFDGGRPSESFDQDIFDDPRSSQQNLTTDSSPQVELDIDLSSNGFSDWLEAFSDADAKHQALKRFSRLKSVKRRESKEVKANGSEDFAPFSEDMIASLRGMDASYLGTLPEHDDVLTGSSSPKPPTSSPITVPDGSPLNNGQALRPTDLSIGTSTTTRPLSSQSDTTFSALSGTTLARALISNSFILSAEHSSRYRSGIGAGLTRSDSTTLPRDSLPMFYNDRFSIGPDAPPIPLNAEFLYEPPQRLRNGEKPTKQELRGQYSARSLNAKLSSETLSVSSNTRPDSAIINVDVDFDLQALLPNTPPRAPSIPRSPLPDTPTSRQPIDEAISPNQANTPTSFQEVTQQVPVDAQLLSPDLNSPSPAPSSEGHTSPKELDGLLNYYSAPDTPEILISGGVFIPVFSPISEESSSQLSPPVSYRSDRRDSHRSQPAGARSPSHRVRADSTLLPWKDQHAGPRPQLLQPVEQGAQSGIVPVSPSTTSDSSFYLTGDNSPEAALAPPQLGKISDGQTPGNVPSPIRVVRDSRDMNAYDITVTSLSGDTIPLEEGIIVTQDFPETPDAFSPMFSAAPGKTFQPGDGHEGSSMPTSPKSAATLGRSDSHSNLAAQMLLNRASVRHSTQRNLGKIRTATTARSGSPSKRIPDILEPPEVNLSTWSNTEDSVTAEGTPQFSSSELSASQSNVSLSLDGSRSPSRGPNIGQDASDGSSSMYTLSETDSASRMRMKSLPSIPMTSPIMPPSADDESPPVSLPETSTTPIVLLESIPDPRPPTPPQTVKAPVPRGRLPPALTISKHTSVSGPGGPVAVNGTDQSGQGSPELEQPPRNSSEDVTTPALSSHFLTQSSLPYPYDAPQGRASDIFRGTSLGSPPPYYSVVNEALMQDNRSPNQNFPVLPSSSHSQAPDNLPGPSGAESTHSNNDDGRLVRQNSFLGQRARIRPPLPAGPRRPSQQLTNSPGSMSQRRESMASVASNSQALDIRARPSLRYTNSTPSPTFQVPPPKWRGYTMEVAKWTFTSAQLQAIVSRAIRQSAESSSIRLLRLEVLDNEIPEEIQRLTSQSTETKLRYKTLTQKRATIMDLLYSSLSALEDGNSTQRLLRQVDELREVTQTLDRLAEEIYSVDHQLSHLESLTHIHTGSALAMALRKLNSSFLTQVAENQVLRSQIQSLEAERDEAWQQAQNVANEYDQISDNTSSPSQRSSRVSAKRKSTARISRAGLRPPSQRLSRRSSPGSGAAIFNFGPVGNKTPPVPPLPRRRPKDILTDSPVRSSAALSSSVVTPTSESRALAKAQDELYAMLGILNPERSLHRSRSDVGLGSPVATSSHLLSPRSAESPWIRRSSLPGALSLTEAYNVMAVDRNAVLATIDMLSATE